METRSVRSALATLALEQIGAGIRNPIDGPMLKRPTPMPPPNQSRTLGAALILLAAVTVGPNVAAKRAQGPSLPAWSTLNFSASKLMVTARSSLSVSEESLDAAQSHWAELSDGGRGSEAAGGATVRLESKTSMLSRVSITTVWVQPGSLAAFQRTLIESGSRARKKVYRFSDAEAVAFRSEPANKAEQDLPEPRWTKRGEQHIDTAGALTVTDPLALFYLIATHPHNELDLGIEVDVLTRNRISKVRIKRTATRATIRTTSTVTTVDGSQHRASTPNLAVRIYEVTPVNNAGDLRLLGLEGAIQVAVDETLRMPVEIRGKIPPVGRVTVKLRSATLR